MNDALGISIIIPTLNEAQGLGRVLEHLNTIKNKKLTKEIIVVDGGSHDRTIEIASHHDCTVVHSKAGRATQMNKGAEMAQGELLYFLHADTYPPKKFDHLILTAVHDGFEAGCFRMRFDTKNPILRFFAWLSRVNHTLCRGGDQSLFITRTQFRNHQGFDEKYLIYEDSEFIQRIYKNLNFKVLPQNVITSARKYRQKGWMKVQFHFGMIHLKNFMGAPPNELYSYYKKHLLN
ncbi:TIGR04283 family arsenosugar biosynthesis glycosyltransferase [Muricauda sp. SCSIO 64092]|uniref:TIGR04283 family arsenosugar biosynthesis glycosyltransferase n=1 Tax=Allomuricauda sp. SCSIO 64092 TaxID=2908842 RepID=UPI001FF501AB|nr:TIGR04283 family arsenosugar biosynthesis glycosyltransferase [Muricauda sp. SCSIO 64092]UOY08200.1 TIGR04283 family arsenosugar biosynthesis glycosyltransferase [Muricauda sp. SCSIO 64092]